MTPGSPLLGLSRADLCTVGRELMLAGHLQDRAGIPAVLATRTMDEAFELAIDEWMMASPIYTRRLQRLLGFEGDDVPTVFKGLQLDVGFAHQFMDVGYELHDDRNGEFWLRSCGALADVVPMGEPFVKGMCHDIEDPTFDATAVATNPRARVRPVHRPPAVPRGGPDCHWTITIDDAAEETQPHPWLADMERSVIARVANDVDPVGYGGPFDPQFELESLSLDALRIVVREFAVQGHLLARAMMVAVDRRYGAEEAIAAGRGIWTGIAWVASQRLAAALGTDDLSSVLPLTHVLLPADYVGITVEGDALVLDDAALGLTEGDPYSLPGLLDLGAHEIVESLVRGVDPTAKVTPDGTRAWVVERGALDPTTVPDPVSLVRISTGAAVTLRRRVPAPAG